jgi:hypothetical protein
MGKSFWDTVSDPCFAFEIDTGDSNEVKELREEVKELKKIIKMSAKKMQLEQRSMKRIKSMDADYELLE